MWSDRGIGEPIWLKRLAVIGTVAVITVMLILPLAVVFTEAAAFGMAALLAAMAIATIVLRMALEWQHRRSLARGTAAMGSMPA